MLELPEGTSQMIVAPDLLEEFWGTVNPAATQSRLKADSPAPQILEANAAWAARWHKHCPACNGWGGFSEPLTDAHSGEFTWCTALGAEQCHRCGEPGLSAAGVGPCRACAWNYDDGMEDPIDLA